MEKKDILQSIKLARENSKERKFAESIDIVINLKGLNIKKENEKILAFIPLPFQRGKRVKVAALVDQALSTKAKADCDDYVLLEDFKKQDKKQIRKLAKKTDYFIAQANIMPKVAQTFGRVLGPRGMMPNPKAGCVVPSTADLKPLVERLQKLVRIETKNEPTIKTSLGSSKLKDDELAENALAIYNYVLHHVPQETNNIKNVLIKTSMGKPVVVGEKVAAKK
ncbi:50S ribosomal protein L1 [Candidatus Woesearchaeota archaeon]|jgi:large subunit ribosomal protein L1|nr:50S ribosomal protein L1 [Candidatus Woesearchaeota archaeon]MBT6044882.1 50S ribosomal protein L1 [Candidatus Woesearchaeota archaeon]